ncbi:oligoribonuclease [Thermocatellispora tengchongensis]
MVTDAELNQLDNGVDVVIKPPPEALEQMSEVVREMHTASGLLPALGGGVTLAEAESLVLDYIRGHVTEPKRAPLCGNSIATDRAFLARDMPGVDSYLHYRMIDVSSIKELVRRWYPRVYFASPEKQGGHRALADITESIRELRYYRAAVFVPLPGPDSTTARGVAELISGT